MGRAISHPTHHFVEQTNVQRNLLKSYGIVARYVERSVYDCISTGITQFINQPP